MSANHEKIAAVVVTYNRKDLLGECLDALLKQTYSLNAVYVIDNGSTDGTDVYLLERGLIRPASDGAGLPPQTTRTVGVPGFADRHLDVHYVRMPENTGGAGGFHEGIKRAVEAGSHWLWVMDDDLLPSADALERLVETKHRLEAVQEAPFMLNSVVLVRGRSEDDALAFPLQELTRAGRPRLGVYHWRLSEVAGRAPEGLYRWACPFNGTFIPARIIGQVGLPNKEFFIKGDEKDFLWRVARRFSVYTVLDSKVFHPRPQDDTFDWKQYYHVRNMLVVNRYFDFTALRNVKLILVSLARGLRHGRRGVTLVLRAVTDGLTGRMGKRDDIHTWPDG